MKRANLTRALTLTFAGLLMSSLIWAQGDKSKRPSPPATATGKVAGATVTINYSSPSVKGRKIWGDLVPYDKVWRAGANEATLFETDKDITVGGKKLPKGKYSLYAVPGEKEWTWIFNSQTGQWGIKMDGSTTEDPAKDVIKVTAKPEKTGATEKLTYDVTDKGFDLKWETVKVSVPIK